MRVWTNFLFAHETNFWLRLKTQWLVDDNGWLDSQSCCEVSAEEFFPAIELKEEASEQRSTGSDGSVPAHAPQA